MGCRPFQQRTQAIGNCQEYHKPSGLPALSASGNARLLSAATGAGRALCALSRFTPATAPQEAFVPSEPTLSFYAGCAMSGPILRLAVLFSMAACIPNASRAEEHTFRIRFGLTDTEPTAWDGSVSVAGGEVKGLRNWRPRAADSVTGSTWSLATTAGAQFRYRNWEPEPPTPVPAYVNVPGLILTVQAEGDARVDLDTAGGNLSFRLSEMPPESVSLTWTAAPAWNVRQASRLSLERAITTDSLTSLLPATVPTGSLGRATGIGPTMCLCATLTDSDG